MADFGSMLTTGFVAKLATVPSDTASLIDVSHIAAGPPTGTAIATFGDSLELALRTSSAEKLSVGTRVNAEGGQDVLSLEALLARGQDGAASTA